MTKKNKSQQFRLKNIDQTKKYFIEKVKKNELMKNSNYIKHWKCFHFCFCFFSWNSCKYSWYYCRYCKFCSKNKIYPIIAVIKKYKSIIQKEIKNTTNSILKKN